MLKIGLEELLFQAAARQHLIDLEQLVAESSVIDIALDGGQNFGQRQVEWDNEAGHEASVYSSLQSARLKSN
jgi:hypothetical protein